eukprot:361211-Chlamydomonas_euryale.AAC.4
MEGREGEGVGQCIRIAMRIAAAAWRERRSGFLAPSATSTALHTPSCARLASTQPPVVVRLSGCTQGRAEGVGVGPAAVWARPAADACASLSTVGLLHPLWQHRK